MVPEPEFESYYGRQILKTSVWKQPDVPLYLFVGGIAGASAVLAEGAALAGLPLLERNARVAAATGAAIGSVALVHDLGRPERFHHMLRVAKPTSPMSVGTWILTAYGPFAGLAATAELVPRRFRGSLVGRLLGVSARPAGLVAAVVAPAVASYTAVLLSDTATPTWHDSHRHLPFVFVGSACAASGGLGMIGAPVAEAGPARRLAVGGLGRRECAPHSDLDLVLLHTGTPGIDRIASAVWYPIWDARHGLDHSVRTLSEALSVAMDDHKVALGLLDDHMGHCLVDAARAGGAEQDAKLKEASEAIARLVRS